MLMLVLSLVAILQVASLYEIKHIFEEANRDDRARAVRKCIEILRNSPTWMDHSSGLCFCKMCSYIRGNVTEMEVYAHYLERK